MTKTTVTQKLGLISFGILTSFVLLEIVLRLGGYIFDIQQDFLYRKAVANSRDKIFRILCIGESTTALGGENAYPYQLKNILNGKNLGVRFEVFNRGLVSKTSGDILAELGDNIKKYKPDLVVSMVGINDIKDASKMQSWSARIDLWADNIRVYKLFKKIAQGLWLNFGGEKVAAADFSPRQSPADQDITLRLMADHALIPDSKDKGELNQVAAIQAEIIKTRISQERLKKTISTTHDQAEKEQLESILSGLDAKSGWDMVYLGWYYRQRNDFGRSEEIVSRAIELHPMNFGAFLEMARIYVDQKKYQKAIPYFVKAVNLAGNKNEYSLLGLGRCYNALEKYHATNKIYKLIFSRKPKDFWIYPEIGNWFLEHEDLNQAAQVFEEAVRLNARDYTLYETLSKIYARLGQKEKARRILEQNREKSRRELSVAPQTAINYNKIADTVLNNGAKLVCMQYPLRSVEPLKGVLRSRDKITFVENKENFEQALESSQYTVYFSDTFAGNFGHCTRAGNQLIAKNLASVIEKEFFGKLTWYRP